MTARPLYHNPADHYVEKVHKFALGLDLGQTNDPTALSVVEQIREGTGEWRIEPSKERYEKARTWYRLAHLERLPLGTTYVRIVEYVGNVMQRPPLNGKAMLVVDQTGVGRPVVDLFRAAGVRPLIAITITGGDGSSGGVGDCKVSKLELISTLEAKMHSGDIKVPAALAEGPALAAELKDFRRNITAAGRATFAARVGKHDDLVLATALPVWHLENYFEARVIKLQGVF